MGAKGTHPSNGVVKARRQGSAKHASWVLTIPSVVAQHLDFETDERWYRAELTSEGILFRPVSGRMYRPVPVPEPLPSRMPGNYRLGLPEM